MVLFQQNIEMIVNDSGGVSDGVVDDAKDSNNFANVSWASSEKLDLSFASEGCNSNDYFIAFNFKLLKNLVAAKSCPRCLVGFITVIDFVDSAKRLCHLLKLACIVCCYSK